MIETFNNLIIYLKNPDFEEDTNTSFKYRLRIFFHFLLICILTSLFLTPLLGLIQVSGLVDMQKHKVTELLKQLTPGTMFLLAAVIAPIFEELIFRAPLTIPFFKKKNIFKLVFYTFAILFGFVHLSNFKITTNIILLSPLLVLPQIILGSYLGCIRIKFGLLWSILLHATYNSIFILISFAGDSL